MRAENTYCFEPITLREMDQVKLMNRRDTKYWFHASQLESLFSVIQNDYYMMNMNGEVVLPYLTQYFDTSCGKMFVAHHNGKLNRYKIRRRTYLSSGVSYLEIKFKNNKGRTQKQRIPSHSFSCGFSEAENAFIETYTPFSTNDLTGSLTNNFSRITLVNKNLKERCTIDSNLQFMQNNELVLLGNLVIVEIKSDGCASASPLSIALRNRRIKISGFSKYCIGRAVTDKALKRNLFKSKIRKIEKELQLTQSLYQS